MDWSLLHWFGGLSDESVERQCRTRLSVREFPGVGTGEGIPGAMPWGADARKMILRRGTLVDAIITESTPKPLPRWNAEHRSASDPEAPWAVKCGKSMIAVY